MCLKWNKNTNEWIFQRIRISSIDNHIITRGDRIPLSQSFLLMLERQCKQLSVSPQQHFVSPTLLKLKLLSGLWHVTWGWAPCFNVRSYGLSSVVTLRWRRCHARCHMSHSWWLTLHTDTRHTEAALVSTWGIPLWPADSSSRPQHPSRWESPGHCRLSQL